MSIVQFYLSHHENNIPIQSSNGLSDLIWHHISQQGTASIRASGRPTCPDLPQLGLDEPQMVQMTSNILPDWSWRPADKNPLLSQTGLNLHHLIQMTVLDIKALTVPKMLLWLQTKLNSVICFVSTKHIVKFHLSLNGVAHIMVW